MNDATDETIARRVQQGEIDAFSLLMERYEKKIIRYGKKFLSCSDDIKDIAQEIFTRLLSISEVLTARGNFPRGFIASRTMNLSTR